MIIKRYVCYRCNLWYDNPELAFDCCDGTIKREEIDIDQLYGQGERGAKPELGSSYIDILRAELYCEMHKMAHAMHKQETCELIATDTPVQFHAENIRKISVLIGFD